MNNKKKIVIVGGGSSALFLAAQLDGSKYDIHLYEQKSSLGRKFLVAGKGGFNLSFQEEMEDMIDRYTPSAFIKPFINAFNSTNFRKWLSNIGIPTYVGTSNRVFPEQPIKPIQVLKAILNQISVNGVQIHTNHCWKGFVGDGLHFECNGKQIQEKADYYIWALGGASWKRTGSDGLWINKFSDIGIETVAFQASNCAFEVNWDKEWIKQNEGKALKNISVTCDGKSKKGELVITSFGLEGNAIYPLSPQIRKIWGNEKNVKVFIDLKPMWSYSEVLNKLNGISSSEKRTNGVAKVMKFSKAQLSILKASTSKISFHNNELLAQNIKALSIELVNLAPIDEAISTIGGLDLNELSENLSLKQKPTHFIIGEMIDYDAPTGGYLLQSCFCMASFVAQELNSK